MRLLQYLLFPMLFLKNTTRVAVPCRTLAVLDGVQWTGNYRARERLHFFEERT